MISPPESAQHRQTCKRCGRPDKFDFHVPDPIWVAIVPPELRNRVVCLYCFDDLASEYPGPLAAHLRILYFAGDRFTLRFEAASAKDFY